jgi:Uma2 family endonuclease
MVQTKPRFQSFEDYLAYDDGSETLYELFNGELIAVPPESGLNTSIVVFLLMQFVPLVGFQRVKPHSLELEVRGEPKNRYPDLTIIRKEHVALLARRTTIRLSMAPPLLVIEVVSPGELQRDRDYIAKRRQYEDLGIPEYWIVDPQSQTVLVLALNQGTYQEVGTFAGEDTVRSPQFPDLTLQAKEIFAATMEPSDSL